jgi:hypothetical protein
MAEDSVMADEELVIDDSMVAAAALVEIPTLELRNARFNEHGTIDVEFLHPIYGWIDTTSSPDDDVEYNRRIYAQALEGEVAAYVPPSLADQRISMVPLSARQLRLGLLQAGITGSTVAATLNAMPEGAEKESALIEWEYATTFVRTHELIGLVGSALGLTPEQIDTMWLAAAAL